MKGKTTGRGLKALAVSTAFGLALGLGLTSCSRDYTVGYLYVTNAKANPGLITGYGIDYNTGQLNQLADSPVPSGGNNTVTLVAAPGGKMLYVLNHDTSTVVQFAIGTDGKLYPENTYNVVQGSGATGTFPVAAAVDPAGKFLYILFTYQNGYTVVRPGPGGVATFPINADGSLGAALTNTSTGTALPYTALGSNPTAISIPATGGSVYILDQDGPPGHLLSFSENTSTGVLTATGVTAGIPVGGTPSALAEDQAGRYVFVTDSASNKLYAFAITGGVPASAPTFTIATGQTPVAVTIDPRGLFAYVANYTSSTVSAFTINASSSTLLTPAGVTSVATGPTCVAIDPALGVYLYTSNSLANNISAEQLNAKTGVLEQVQNTPYTSQVLPSCLVAVANGAHATQLVQ